LVRAQEGEEQMKKVWLGLSIACLLFGIVGMVEDVMSGSSIDDAGVLLFVGVLFAAFFGWLAWLWRTRSPLKRAAEQTAAAADKLKKNNEAYDKLSDSLKWRVWKFRIIGGLVAIFGLYIWIAGDWQTLWIVVGTVVLIVGIAVFMMGSPADYNSLTDTFVMIPMDEPRKIREFYEAFKEVQTPLGSAWLGTFYSSGYENLIFGPDERGQFMYFYLNGSGEIGYIGYSFLEGFIKKKLTQPVYPVRQNMGEDTIGHLCYHTDVFFFKDWLKESIEHFIATGQVLPFRESKPSEVYTFTEEFKLAGEHFDVKDKSGEVLYTVEGIEPLIQLHIYDRNHEEVFKMVKEIGHALATYRFYERDQLYGVLEKQFTFVRDTFAMYINDGKLELVEYAGTIGHNFRVLLNGEIIGAIMDDMDLSIRNVIWDNAFLVVYDEKYLPLIIAMAVMITRELARDKDGGVLNRIDGVVNID